MKCLLTLCLSTLLFISCNKKKTSYYQLYNITYYSQGDSFVATASYYSVEQMGAFVQLSSKESVTFNGREQDEIVDNVYIWRGNGKIDANFVLTKHKQTFKNSIALSQKPVYEILCNDTVHKSKDFVVKVKDYTPMPGDIGISLCTKKNIGSNPYEGDSVVFASTGIQSYDNGPAYVRLNQNVEMTLQSSDENSGGKMYLTIYNDRAVYITD